MQMEREQKDTEQFALEEEKREIEWQKKYAREFPEIIRQMNQLLKQNDREGYIELYNICHEGEIFNDYMYTDIMADMHIITSIYKKEEEAGIKNHILKKGNTIDDLRRYFQKIKFMIYKFDCDVCDENEWLVFYKKFHISTIMLEAILEIVAMRPIQVALKLEQIFKQKNMYAEQLCIYNVLCTKYPGNARVDCELAQLYLKAGKIELAQQTLMQIPLYIRENEKNRQELLYKMQELLWMIRYKQWGACSMLVELIEQNQVVSTEWNYILETEHITDLECYLQLAEMLIDHKCDELARVTLMYGKENCLDE